LLHLAPPSASTRKPRNTVFQIRSSWAQFVMQERFQRVPKSMTCIFSMSLNIPTPPPPPSTLESTSYEDILRMLSRHLGRWSNQEVPREQGRHFSGIQLRVDSKPSHSVYECSSADTQSDCSAIRTAYAALVRAKRLYDFLALLLFVQLKSWAINEIAAPGCPRLRSPLEQGFQDLLCSFDDRR
jgi:hypothetical protein